MISGLAAEPDRKEKALLNDNNGGGLDLEFETEGSTLAAEPASYETAYVTSHKQACRAGSFSFDGQLVATGSVDASIKVKYSHILTIIFKINFFKLFEIFSLIIDFRCR